MTILKTLEDFEQLEDSCPHCNSDFQSETIGILGNLLHVRCRACHAERSYKVTAQFAAELTSYENKLTRHYISQQD